MKKEITQTEIEAVKTILRFIGENPDREGLQDTPTRFLKAWRDYFGRGYQENPEAHLKLFTDGASNYNEMIFSGNISVWSFCEHHIVPFFGKACVAYIPGPSQKIIGLSKLNRIVDCFARKLQVQERLTTEIADFLDKHLQPLGCAVFIECEHLCVKSRGIQDDSITKTSALRGLFLHDSKARSEFFSYVKESK